MKHEVDTPAVFAASAFRDFPKVIASLLLVLLLITALLGSHLHDRRSSVETPSTPALAARAIDCGMQAAGGSSHCQQSGTYLFFEKNVVSNRDFCSALRISILDASGRIQHWPDSLLRPPTPSSSVA